MKCPFRKETYFVDSDGHQVWEVAANHAHLMQEEFRDCIGDKCIAYYNSPYTGHGFCKMVKNEKLS